MAEFQDLSDKLLALECIENKKFLWVFGKLVYKPTGEKVEEGFRYFDCDIGPVADATARLDLEALMNLPFAFDDDGDVDTSGVLVNLAYTTSGTFAAIQAVQYQDYQPVPLAEATILEGEQAKALAATMKELDQSA